MWLSVILVCANQFSISCQVIANNKNMHQDEATCVDDAKNMSKYLYSKGLLAFPSCIEIGTNI